MFATKYGYAQVASLLLSQGANSELQNKNLLFGKTAKALTTIEEVKQELIASSAPKNIASPQNTASEASGQQRVVISVVPAAITKEKNIGMNGTNDKKRKQRKKQRKGKVPGRKTSKIMNVIPLPDLRPIDESSTELLPAGIIPNTTDAFGFTPLMRVVREQDKVAVSSLLLEGAKPDTQDKVKRQASLGRVREGKDERERKREICALMQ